MATNVEIIQDALRDLGVIAETQAPSAEQGKHGLRKLNEMIEAWTEDDIDLGYFEQASTSDNCPIPDWAIRGVKGKLAIELAPTYGASVSAELATNADNGYSMIVRKSINEKLAGSDMDHLPRGQGRYGRGYNINTDI